MNPDGNKRLTAAVGVLLLAPVLLEIATVLLGVHTFMSWHVFVGIALIPLVVLKLATTGWRFVRYYTRSRAFVAHGPPQPAMRLLAPLLVVATVVLFGSGVAMGLFQGHASRTTTTGTRRVSPLRGTGRLRSCSASGRSSRRPATPFPWRPSGRVASTRRE